jgi:cell division protease FtsH
LEELAQLLLEKEVIFKEDLERILGVRPYIDRQTQIDEAETSAQIEKDRIEAANEVVAEVTENSTASEEELKEEQATDTTETSTTEEN